MRQPMIPVIIQYGDLKLRERNEAVYSLEDLRQRLRAIDEEYSPQVGMPFGVDLVGETGDRLNIALGQNRAAISHFDAKQVSTVTAVGDLDAQGTSMFYFGDETVLPNKFLIPVETAWKVIEEWCERGVLSPLVTWTSAIR